MEWVQGEVEVDIQEVQGEVEIQTVGMQLEQGEHLMQFLEQQ